jgi:tetratricopeptide (TPR) repeat protein
LLARQGRYADAAAALAKAFDAAPSLGAALQTYAAASRAGLPSPDAELRTWMASHPDDPAGRLALGTIAMDRGQQAEAIEQYEAVLRAAPGQPVALNNLAWLYSERGDARALDYATRAYAANPDNPAIADTLGWLHVQQGEPAVGLPLLGKAAAAMPAEAEVGYHWAMALAATGDRDKALRELQRLLASGAQFAGRADAQRKAAELQAAAVN